MNCPSCKFKIGDVYYLKNENVHKYLPTAKQVIDYGLGKFLSEELRRENGI